MQNHCSTCIDLVGGLDSNYWSYHGHNFFVCNVTIFVDDKINGRLFLTLVDDVDLLNDLKLSKGGRRELCRIVQVRSFTSTFPSYNVCTHECRK